MPLISIKQLFSDYSLRLIGRNGYLVPIHTVPDQLILLNSSALLIYRHLAVTKNVSQAIHKLSASHSLKPDIAKKYIVSFLNQLSPAKTLPPAPPSVDSPPNYTTHGDKNTLYAAVELTGQCNLKCLHCYATPLRTQISLSTNQWLKIFKQLHKSNTIFINLSGGECLAHPGFIKIYTYLRQNGFVVTINSNLTLLSPTIKKLLEAYPPLKVKTSLYGPNSSLHQFITQSPTSFAKTTSACRWLNKHNIPILASVLVMQHNHSKIRDFKTLSRKLNVPFHYYHFLIPKLDSNVDPLTFSAPLEQYSKTLHANGLNNKFQETGFSRTHLYPCTAGKYSYHIDNQGRLTLCKMERTEFFNLKNTSFKNSWKNLKLLRNKYIANPTVCSKCPLVKQCHICPPTYRLLTKSQPNACLQRTKMLLQYFCE